MLMSVSASKTFNGIPTHLCVYHSALLSLMLTKIPSAVLDAFASISSPGTLTLINVLSTASNSKKRLEEWQDRSAGANARVGIAGVKMVWRAMKTKKLLSAWVLPP